MKNLDHFKNDLKHNNAECFDIQTPNVEGWNGRNAKLIHTSFPFVVIVIF